MPKRRGVVLKPTQIIGAKYIRPVDVGQTSTTNNLFRFNPQEEVLERIQGFEHGKLYLDPNTIGKRKAQRVFLKPISFSDQATQVNEETQAKSQANTFNRLREIGLPAPRAHAVQIDGQWFVAVQPHLREANKKSRLIPINTKPNNPTPFFLRQLTIVKDAETISNIAKYTGKLLNAGYYPDLFDFFGFYQKKDQTYGAILMDVSHLQTTHPSIKRPPQSMANDIRRVWANRFTWFRYRKEFALFKKTLLNEVVSQEVKSDLEKGFKGKVKKVSWRDFFY